jgi:hypothetical protein
MAPKMWRLMISKLTTSFSLQSPATSRPGFTTHALFAFVHSPLAAPGFPSLQLDDTEG